MMIYRTTTAYFSAKSSF